MSKLNNGPKLSRLNKNLWEEGEQQDEEGQLCNVSQLEVCLQVLRSQFKVAG